MIDAPYTDRPVPHVAPGDRVYDEEHGPVVVDEIRRGGDGYTFLGWPAHRAGKGRRVSMLYQSGDRVTVTANAAEAAAVLRELHAMVRAANAYEQGDEPGGVSEAPGQYNLVPVDHPFLALMVSGTLWSVPLSLAPAVAPTSAPDPAPAVADDPPEVD